MSSKTGRHRQVTVAEFKRLTDRSEWHMAWFDAPDDRELWSFPFSMHRDSDAVEHVNYWAVVAKLEELFPDSPNILFQRFSHFLVGWIDHVIVKVCRRVPTEARPSKTTAEWRAVMGLVDKLAEYPCLDDDKLSEIELEEAMEYIEREVPSVQLLDGNKRDHLLAQVYSALTNAGHEIRRNHSPPRSAVMRALLSCNVALRHDDETLIEYPGDAQGACAYCGKFRLPHPTRMQYSIDGKLLPVMEGWRSVVVEYYKDVPMKTWWCPDHVGMAEEHYEDVVLSET